jgi:predicted peptidase
MNLLRIASYLFTLVVTTTLIAQESYTPTQTDWIDLYEPQDDAIMIHSLMKPLDYEPGHIYPVIVSLHGGGGRGTDNRRQLKIWNQHLADEDVRRNYPCYVLAPQVTELYQKSDLEKIQQIISGLPSVDTARIYMMGHSMGGHGTNILVQFDPDYFAAIAPSAGTGLTNTAPFIDATLIKNVPIWAFHGDLDPTCPYDRNLNLFNEMKQLGGNMKFTTFKGDRHNIPGKIIPGGDNGTTQFSSDHCDPETDFLTWLFSQKRPDR